MKLRLPRARRPVPFVEPVVRRPSSRRVRTDRTVPPGDTLDQDHARKGLVLLLARLPAGDGGVRRKLRPGDFEDVSGR